MGKSSFLEFYFPSLPETIGACVSQLYSPDIDVDSIAKLVQKDPALVVNILKMANSVEYELSKPTSDLKTGMLRIGFAVVIQIIVAQYMERIFEFKPVGFFNMRSFLQHSIMVSQVAFEIGKISKSLNLQSLFLAGLLHDVGLLVRVYMACRN